MSTRIQLRRDTSANWTSNNPILAQGEPAIETDTGYTKLGDGATAWNSLSYQKINSGGLPTSVVTGDGTDSYGRTAVETTPTGAGLRDFLSARDAPWNAKVDGVTDDRAALNSAQQANSTLWMPDGTSVIKGGGTGVGFQQSKQHIRGQGMYASVLQAGISLDALIESYGSYVSQIEISDLTFDGGGFNNLAVNMWANVGRMVFRRCRFINFPNQIIGQQASASELIVEDCLADGAGTGLGQFLVSTNKNMEVLIARRNRLRWLQQGFLLGADDLVSQSYLSHIEIEDNYIDLGWWILKAIASGSGGAVSYAYNSGTRVASMTDTGASFGTGSGTVKVSQTLRAMTPRRTGTLTSGTNGLVLVDSGANFVAAGVLSGEIVRSGTSFGVVSYVESTTVLHVEEWLDQSTYQPVAPPGSGTSYTVYGLLLGMITAVANTTLTIGQPSGNYGFFDMRGNRATPAAGTLYEIVPQPVYPIHCAPSVDGAAIQRNLVRRGWGDCISYWGKRGVIVGNTVEDGFDTGITNEPNAGGLVASNRVRHCGGVGIGVYGSGTVDLEIAPNQAEDNGWINPIGDIYLLDAVGVNLTGGKSKLSSLAVDTSGLYITGASTSNVAVRGFEGIGHPTDAASADILLNTNVPAGTVELLDVKGNIVYRDTTKGQRLRIKGTGVPSISASVGSEFLRTDGGAGSTLYVKETGNGTTGWGAK